MTRQRRTTTYNLGVLTTALLILLFSTAGSVSATQAAPAFTLIGDASQRGNRLRLTENAYQCRMVCEQTASCRRVSRLLCSAIYPG